MMDRALTVLVCLLAGSLSADTPKIDWTRAAREGGCATVWFYDCELTRIQENKVHTLDVGIERRTADGRDSRTVEIRREKRNWRPRIRPAIPGKQEMGYSSESFLGWNRFDVVAAGVGKNEPVRFYLNGREIYATPEPFDGFSSLATGYFTNRTETVVSAGGDSFRPAPVCAIMPERALPQVCLKPNDSFRFSVELDPRGAAGDRAELSVELLNGRGEAVDAVTTTVMRTTRKVDVSFSLLPRSGRYTVETKYLAAGMPHPDRTRRNVSLQFYDPATTDPEDAPLTLSGRPWSFLPGGPYEDLFGRAPKRVPTDRDFQLPEAVPADWSRAESVDFFWREGGWGNFGRPYYGAWHRQSVVVPKTWRGRHVILDICEPMTRAAVFVNSVRLPGTVDYPGGEVDVTDQIRFGEANDIAIYVAADPYFGLARTVREIIGESFRRSVPEMRGLGSEVTLYPREGGAHIDAVQARPAVRPDRLGVAFDLTDLESGKRYRVGGEVCEKGRTVLKLPETVFVATGRVQQVILAADFPDARYWEIGNPWLYDLTVRLDEARGPSFETVSRTFPERFGFRQLDWNGPTLKLNGRRFTHLTGLGEPGRVPDLVAQAAVDNRTSFYGMRGIYNANEFDEAGLTGGGRLLMYCGAARYVVELVRAGKIGDPRFWTAATKQQRRLARMYRNHPSVFQHIGVLGGNHVGNGAMYNPLYENGTWIGRYPKDRVRDACFAPGERLRAEMAALDPTRYVTVMDAGSINDIRHITEYIGWTPLQEAIERAEFWSKISTKPFIIDEQAAPFFANWTDACWMGKGWQGVPTYQERAAALVGDDAWILSPWYAKVYAGLEKTQRRKRDEALAKCKTPAERREACLKTRLGISNELSQQQARQTEDVPLHCALTREISLAQIFHSRWHGIAGISFGFVSGTSASELMHEGYEPVTGFLAGPATAISDRTHILRPGETFRRSAACLNNTAVDAALDVEWQLTFEGRVVASGRRAVVVPAGGRTAWPIDVRLDKVGKGVLTVAFSRQGVRLRGDSTDVQVVAEPPRVSLPANIRIALVDPLMETMKEFERLGIPFHYTVFDEDLSAYDLIVFGKRAFSYESATLPEGLDLGSLVKQGKRIVIFEQDEEVLRERFRLRTDYNSPRCAFVRGNFAFDEDLLRYWRGSATLTDGYEVARRNPSPANYMTNGANDGGEWQYLGNDGKHHARAMKWGNRHQVATVTVIKPDTGGFRTLVDCEFAHNYAAALEYVEGSGRVVFSQLDVCGRTETDPAAQLMIVRLLEYAVKDAAVPVRRLAYEGGERGRKLLQLLTVPVDGQGTDILVLGEMPKDELVARKDRLASFVKEGGVVFALPQEAATLSAGWTPFGLNVETVDLRQDIIDKPRSPLLAGLGNGDFYYREPLRLTTVNGHVVAEIPYGKGRYVFCQVSPEMFGDVVLDHWFREARDRTERMIRTLLTNLGARQLRPRFLSVPRSEFVPLFTRDLAGKWQAACTSSAFVFVRKDLDRAAPALADWRPMAVPGAVQEANPAWRGVTGEAWIRRTFTVDEPLPPGSRAALLIGNVSGENVVWINGRRVGVTDVESDVNTVASMSRRYEFDAAILRTGVNEIAVRVAWNAEHALGLRHSDGSVSGAFELSVERPNVKAEKVLESIDLASRSEWWGACVTHPDERPRAADRQRFSLPGAVHGQMEKAAEQPPICCLRREIVLPESIPASCHPVIEIAAIADEDWVSVNGQIVGHTGMETDPTDYWRIVRKYPVDRSMLKPGKKNTIEIVVRHEKRNATVTGPMTLHFEDPAIARARLLAETPYLRETGREDDPYWHHGF